MKLATIRVGGATRAVRADGDLLTDLGAADLGEFLATGNWRKKASAKKPAARTYHAKNADFAPVVPDPSKVICVGLNYRNRIQEMGRDLPEYPALFAKFADCLIGDGDDISKPEETERLDWGAELAVVIGQPVRRAAEDEAAGAIAGFTVLNDITCRDWQFRTEEWLQGKMWDSSTPVGPYLVTPDDLGGTAPALDVTLTVDGEIMQSGNTGDLLFGPVELVRYISAIIRLNPGDIIATGTPGGVGQDRTPPRFLAGGETVVAEIQNIGRLASHVVRASSSTPAQEPEMFTTLPLDRAPGDVPSHR